MRAGVLFLLTGCAISQVREARAIQPNPVRAVGSGDELPVSAPLYIYTRDMWLPRSWQLRSAGTFTVVNRDMIRFHLSVVRYDEREADTSSWKVWLEDENGRRLEPASREMAHMDRLLLAWVRYWEADRPYKNRAVPGWNVYQGKADYVFRAPSLMTKDRKRLSMVAERDGYQMRFTWTFDEGELMTIQHYGRSRVDDEMQYLIAPSGDTQVAQSWYEGDEP